MRACWLRWRRCSLISDGPVAQFRPKTSGCSGSTAARAAPISVPGSMRPVSSIVTWTCIGTVPADRGHGPPAGDHGRLQAEQVELGLDEQQVDAALEQARAPAPRRRRAARRSGSGRGWPAWCPGRSSRPRSRRSPDATSRAMRAAFTLISCVLSAMPYSLSGTANAPNVAVSTTSTPTAKKASCMPATRSGRVSTRISLQPSSSGPPKSSAVRPCSCMYVPNAPSYTTTRSSTRSRNALRSAIDVKATGGRFRRRSSLPVRATVRCAAMGEIVEFPSNGHTASGYLARPAGRWWSRARGDPGVVGPRPPHRGRVRPVRGRGVRGARARPLPRRDHDRARRGRQADDGDEPRPGRAGHGRCRGVPPGPRRGRPATSSASPASAWAVGSRWCWPASSPTAIAACVPWYGIIPWEHAEPDWSALQARCSGHFASEDGFFTPDAVRALERS